MNDAMWAHAATQANVAHAARARRDRARAGLPGAWPRAGEAGPGRLPEPADLLAAIEGLAAGRRRPPSAHLAGLRVLVTAGGTREPIDAVRFVGNRSSGRMGFALAEQAAALGADVTVVAANVALAARPARALRRRRDRRRSCRRPAPQAFAHCDVLLMAAAVADFRPARSFAGKLKKAADERMRVELERTPDILAGLASTRRADQTLVGFAAEHGEGALEHGRDKLARKRVDAVVVNDIARADIGFESPDNEVTILTAAGETHVARASKAEVARAVLDAVIVLRMHVEAETTGPAAGSCTCDIHGDARWSARRRSA